MFFGAVCKGWKIFGVCCTSYLKVLVILIDFCCGMQRLYKFGLIYGLFCNGFKCLDGFLKLYVLVYEVWLMFVSICKGFDICVNL